MPIPVVEPVRVPRAAEVLADYLRSQIIQGVLPVGAHLPPERTLAEQSELSRSSVRQAIRSLEMQGLVTVRSGQNGGAFVSLPSASIAAKYVETFILGGRVRIQSVLEARMLIEPACAAMAAARRTDRDLENLAGIGARLETNIANESEFLSDNAKWHVAVAQASKNELLAAFMGGIANAVREATDTGVAGDLDTRSETVRAHSRVVDAIRDGDSAAAQRRIRRHVRAYCERAADIDDAGISWVGLQDAGT